MGLESILVRPDVGTGKWGIEIVEMDKAGGYWSLLAHSEAGEPELHGLGDYLTSLGVMHFEIGSPSGRVWAGQASATDLQIILRATISACDDQWEPASFTQIVKHLQKANIHEVLTAVTAVKLG